MEREQIISAAKPFLGTPYSKLDCSAFVRAGFRKLGIELPRVSDDQARYFYDRGLGVKVGKGETVKDIAAKLKIGYLIWWGNPKYGERWMEIHHVGIYAGDGKTLESTGSGNGVHIGNLWETREWQIVLYADPISLITKEPETAESEEEMIVYVFQHAAKAAGYKVLKDGAKWLDIVTGENNGCDNQKGDWTEGVIKQVQAKHGLPQTGNIDEKTMQAVFSDIPVGVDVKPYQAQIAELQAKITTARKALG